MWQDPIVEEIHNIREEYAKKFNYDIHAICEDIRKMQAVRKNHILISLQSNRVSSEMAIQSDAKQTGNQHAKM